MRYKFYCPKCEEEKFVDMKMSEYTAENHHCSTCGTELKRDYKDIAGGVKWNCDGQCGKSFQ